MPLRAVVFDFDGVLANSEPLHLRTFQEVLAEERIALDEADYYSRYLGFDDVGVFQMIGAAHGADWQTREIADLVARKALRMEALERDTSVMFPGAADAVRRMASVVPIAIASGALGDEIRRVLDREQLTGCFTAIVAAEDSARGKPAPDPYILALTLLRASTGGELDARDCVAIEDSRWGLESARTAGLRTVAVAQTYQAESLSADLVIPAIGAVDVHLLAHLFPA
jgi:beta-phosphoglucomutase-like phosphatase (HAD superfamily)